MRVRLRGETHSGSISLRHSSTDREPLSDRPIRRFRLSVLALAAVFGLFSFGASRVEASCGDYLRHRTASHDGMTKHDHSSESHNRSNQSRPDRRPCQGPTCQQAPVEAPVPPPITSVEPQDRWGWVTRFALAAPEPTSSLTVGPESVQLPLIAFRLDRPPKA